MKSLFKKVKAFLVIDIILFSIDCVFALISGMFIEVAWIVLLPFATYWALTLAKEKENSVPLFFVVSLTSMVLAILLGIATLLDYIPILNNNSFVVVSIVVAVTALVIDYYCFVKWYKNKK